MHLRFKEALFGRRSRARFLAGFGIGASMLAITKLLSPRDLALVLKVLGWAFLAFFGLRLLYFFFLAWRIDREASAVASGRLSTRQIPPERVSAVRNKAIGNLYASLGALLGAPPDRAEERERNFARLRELQEEEAAAMQRWFDEHSPLKPGEGFRAIREARALLARYENPPATDSPALHQG
ncbi:MAG TPA: hypothetical protein VJ725_14840 [Thermoanaerobaculia bacterium]|nr:hypothetical protein [Thermoanaerobaculia bacterium]